MQKPTKPPRRYDTPVQPGEDRSLRAFLDQQVDGHTLTSISAASGIAYSTVYRHVEQKLAISARTAMRLEKWSKGRISAAKTLGL